MISLGTLRNHAHIGERRCVPCTIVNLALLWLAVNGVVLLGHPIAAGVGLVLGLVVIWLRGYLVPLTPRFAPKLVAASPIPDEWFHDSRGGGGLAPESTTDADQLLASLAHAGVIEADEQQVYLNRDFEQRWHDEMDRIADESLGSLADALCELPSVDDAHPVEQGDYEWVAIDERASLIAPHVAVAELGAVRALEPVVPAIEDRVEMATPLREFLSVCPVCETPFERSTEVSCCGGHTNPQSTPRETIVCPECDQRFRLLAPVADEA